MIMLFYLKRLISFLLPKKLRKHQNTVILKYFAIEFAFIYQVTTSEAIIEFLHLQAAGSYVC